MKFCTDCNNTLAPVINENAQFNECRKCKKRFEFDTRDTLLRKPAIKPEGYALVAHIVQYMDKHPAFPWIEQPCPKCPAKALKYAILHDTTYYKCAECRHWFT